MKYVPPTLELENKWESDEAMWTMIAAMITYIDWYKRTDNFLELLNFCVFRCRKYKEKVNRFDKGG